KKTIINHYALYDKMALGFKLNKECIKIIQIVSKNVFSFCSDPINDHFNACNSPCFGTVFDDPKNA
ncbi:MAG: hypothetical protein IIZ17_00005, partial [Eubacteriaceae bacterium]|nr:hypothetical protein [Eubacteriaceae bacterium]